MLFGQRQKTHVIAFPQYHGAFGLREPNAVKRAGFVVLQMALQRGGNRMNFFPFQSGVALHIGPCKLADFFELLNELNLVGLFKRKQAFQKFRIVEVKHDETICGSHA